MSAATREAPGNAERRRSPAAPPEPPLRPLANLAAALKLYGMSVLPLGAVAAGIAAGPSATKPVGALVVWVMLPPLALLGAILVTPERNVPLSGVPWAVRWFGPWVAVAAWVQRGEDDGAGRMFVLVLGLLGIALGAAQLPPETRTDVAALGGGDVVLGAIVLCIGAYCLIWSEHQAGRACAAFGAGGRASRPRTRAVALLLGAAVLVWLVRPLWHGPAMLFVQYPLVTWLPLLLGVAVSAPLLVAARRTGVLGSERAAAAARLRRWVTLAAWTVAIVLLPSLEARELYGATRYAAAQELPRQSQPRLLPKAAAEARAGADDLRLAHLVVDPVTAALVWSGERRTGSESSGIALQPLDRLDGTLVERPGGFDPPVSSYGPGSFRWRAYRRHFATRVEEPVIVPLADGRATAIAPYVGYRGLLVRRPYWRGVYVYHQDGRLEDLSPEEAQARPELARSGRLFPERLARLIAEAHGNGRRVLPGGEPTEVGDPLGNPQPYLTNLGDGRVRWITVAHVAGDEDTLATVIQTDASNGATTVWRPPPGRRLLSNEGAVELVEGLPIEWTRCCTDDNVDYPVRWVTEPRPVFAGGRLYYLVSVMLHRDVARNRPPLDRTVLVDAQERRIALAVRRADPGGEQRLRAYLADRG